MNTPSATTEAGVVEAAPVPEVMRAMVLDEFGGDFRLEQRAVPAAGVGAVVAVISLAALLRVEARLLANRSSETDVLFPSPPSRDDEPRAPTGA